MNELLKKCPRLDRDTCELVLHVFNVAYRVWHVVHTWNMS